MPVVFRTVKELKDRTPAVLRDAQDADVIITVRGKPQVILRRFTDEALEQILVRSDRVHQLIAAGIQEARKKRPNKEARPNEAGRDLP